ncbi:MAG: MaoC/PaaZ C-terminal domain-containing protein [Chloroflexi bacterium]|nr:MaoC/PaaZ C-terminal domain-containing protein [Chloroflexota bacterium]
MTTVAKRVQRYWDDVQEGDEVPGYDLPLTPTQMVLHVSGSQDFNPVHHDVPWAHSSGHPDVFVNTGFMTGCFGRLLTDYVGEGGWVKKFRMEMRRMNHPGDVMKLRGKVTRKYEQGDERLLDLDIWCENDRAGVTTPSAATVRLPLRSV